jgi:hypothetical protein
MKRKQLGQSGFIPMLIAVFAVVIALICLIYIRVQHAQ